MDNGEAADPLRHPFAVFFYLLFAIIMGSRQAVRHSTLTAAFAGPNPATPVLRVYGVHDHVAQLVEQSKKMDVDKHPDSQNMKCHRFKSCRGQTSK